MLNKLTRKTLIFHKKKVLEKKVLFLQINYNQVTDLFWREL